MYVKTVERLLLKAFHLHLKETVFQTQLSKLF